MATFSVSATGPYSLEATFSGLTTQNYDRTIYINIYGMGEEYQEEWSLGANKTPKDEYYAEFEDLDPDTKYTVYCTVYRNEDWYVVYQSSKSVRTDEEPVIYYVEADISTNDPGGILSVEPNGEIECDEGEEVTFKAEVADNHLFRGWFTRASGSNSYLETRDNPYTITVDDDITLYARSVAVSLSSDDLTYNSVTVDLSIAYEEFDYYIRVWDQSNGRYFISQRSITYDDVYDGYTITGLSPETTYYINIGYEAGSESDLIWIFDSDHTLKIKTAAEPRYAVGINYANGIKSGQFWGDDIIYANKALQGTSVSFSADVESGYDFYGWYDQDENFVSSKNPYTISSIQEDTTLIAKAIPETLFSVGMTSIVITTIADDVEKIRIYNDNELVKTLTSFSDDVITIDSGIYPSSDYDIIITYNCDGTNISYDSIDYEDEVTTNTPVLSTSVQNNQVTVSLSGGQAYTKSSWSVYFNSPHEEDTFASLSGGNTSATFSDLKYNTKYMFYCNYRVASGTSYSSKTLSASATTAATSPTYTINCYKDDDTVASFNKSPNSTFNFRDEVVLTATAKSSNYQYDYTTPKIYKGSNASGTLVSSTGSYTHIVVASQSFYAIGSRTTRSYSANVSAEYVSDTSQKITVSNLSSTSGLNSYYYLTKSTSSSPVTSISSATSFSRSTGYTTLTGLSSGTYTYYCYVYNSTYGYYYKVGSVTFTVGPAIEKWEWTAKEKAAFESNGAFNVLTAARWNEFLDWCNTVIEYKNGTTISKSYYGSKNQPLYASSFNVITQRIGAVTSALSSDVKATKKSGDIIYGWYFTHLAAALNTLL